MISGLSGGFGPTPDESREYRFAVSHENYKLLADVPVRGNLPTPQLSVRIEPGKVGEVTVRMARK